MKCRIFVAAVLVIAAAFAGRWVTRSTTSSNPNASGREVTRKTFTLDAGARVEVRGINGPVEIKTADTDTADVQVIRTGGAEALEHSNLTIEGSGSSLVVSCENHDGGRGFFRWLWGTGNVRQEVTLTLPRRVDLLTRGVNGPVRVGEVDGPVSVEGVNGRVEVAGASEHVSVNGVNGQVKFAVARLGSEGVDINGVNGNVEVRFRELINADIDVNGNHGGVTLNVPNVTMQERESHSGMRARLGSGGAQIGVNGVNGQIRFESDATASVTNTATTTTTATTAHAPEGDESDEDDLEPPPPPPAPPAQ
ncbi:MAG TPA: hypothetical protein VGP08_23230 [Pyrinomonadaceae bacterium]|jgi:DUF4097 and DUF4098 domain-containing protein YvlB|nr:hypothetical protein [Pyrinomonadaceae bacterium]